MKMPGFTAEVSLYKTSERYQLAAGYTDPAGRQVVIPQAWYCCIMRPFPGAPVVGCRSHNAWYPFAWAGCAGEAAWGQLSATLVEGRCSDRPECLGKIL
jgi:hypothetical protein